jgi:nicotinamidase-related amidase
MQRSEIDAIPLEGDTSFRERAVEPERTALLVIDLQKGEYNPARIAAEPEKGYLFERIRDVVIPNGQKLLAACRAAGVEVIYTVIEALTLDGRDRSLDYKVSGIFFAKGSREAEVLDELQPLPNEIVIPKTSSSLFNSTNFEYVLRNLGIEYVMVMGIVTDQCVETAVRDGCDRGFLMTLIDDACATYAERRHKEALVGFKGYCRIRTTEQLLEELKEITAPGSSAAPVGD